MMNEPMIAPCQPAGYAEGPLLSIVTCAKNEEYMGNYRWRVKTALNLLVRSIAAIGRQRDVEVLVCDWNSDVPFHKELPLLPEARDILRFIVVPPELAVPAQGKSKFPNSICINVCARRARGKYIAIIDADIVLTQATMAALLMVLEGKLLTGINLEKALMLAYRRHLAPARTQHGPTIDEVEGYLNRSFSGQHLELMKPGVYVPAGLQLIPRAIYHETNGYDEKHLNWGFIDVDINLRITQRYPVVNLSNFGVVTVHLEHYSGPQGRAAGPPRGENPTTVCETFALANEKWGMPDSELMAFAPEILLDTERMSQDAAAAVAARAKAVFADSLQGELTDPRVVGPVDNICKSLPEAHVLRNALLLLAWYAHHRSPRSYVEIGNQMAYTTAVVVAACPSVEVYGIDTWRHTDLPVFYSSNMISFNGGMGRARFVSGDPLTAVERLLATEPADFSIDLALIRTAAHHGDAVKNSLLLAERITPGGAMVVVSSTPREFELVCTELKAKYPGWLAVEVDKPGTIGAFIAAPIANRPV